MREVRPGIVISDNVLAMKRQQRSAPFLQLCVDRGFKLLVVSLIKCSIGRIQSGKRLRDMLCNCLGNDRINGEMRIAERMNVTGSSRDVCWYVHKPNAFRRLDS